MELRDWTGRNGQHRRYASDWAHTIGLDIEYYGTGNIRGAVLAGAEISNSEANRILMANPWIDDEGRVHVQEIKARKITAQAIAEAVAREVERMRAAQAS